MLVAWFKRALAVRQSKNSCCGIWYFSVVDVLGALPDQPTQRSANNYWAKLKQRLKEEGADELLTNCQQLKLKSPKDGNSHLTDVADKGGRDNVTVVK